MHDDTQTPIEPELRDDLDKMSEQERGQAFQAAFAELCDRFRVDFRPVTSINLTFYTSDIWQLRKDQRLAEAIKRADETQSEEDAIAAKKAELAADAPE